MPLLGVVRQTAAVVTPEPVEDELEFREAGVGETEPGQEAVQEPGREEEGQAAAQEGKPREPELAGAGIQQAGGRSPLAALEALQLDMEPVNQQACRAQRRLKLRFSERRKHYLEVRSTILRDIRGFWARVVSFMMGGRD